MAIASTKGKKKKWFTILSDDTFGRRELGKTLLYESSALNGKHLKANLMTLTGDMKKQNTNITFKVVNVKDDKGMTKISQYELMPAFTKRMIRRDRDKIDSSFTSKSKDGVSFRVKPLLVTRFKVSASVKTDIRNNAKEWMLKKFKDLDFNEIIKLLTIHKLQGEIKSVLGKIYPLRTAEVRVLKVISYG